MSDESHVMEGFQIKFLLLQKAMTPCQIKRKRKKACRFFFFSVSGQNSSQKAHSAASAVLHLYYIKIWLILKQTACPVMHCRKQLPYCTVATYTKSVTIIWPCGSLTHREIARREEREKTKKSLCFPDSSVPFIQGCKRNIPSIFRRNMSDLSGFEPSSYSNSKA